MNALRQIIEVDSNILSIVLPKEYQKQTLEIIIMPFNNQKNNTQTTKARKKAFDIIDKGITIEKSNEFLAAFNDSRQDRVLPFRD